jgi:hypothetical protein
LANNQLTLEGGMEPKLEPETPHQKLSGIGATEDQMDARATIPQRIDQVGTKVEDLAGTGEVDAAGG